MVRPIWPIPVTAIELCCNNQRLTNMHRSPDLYGRFVSLKISIIPTLLKLLPFHWLQSALFNNCIPLPWNHVIWYKPRNLFVSRLRDLYPTINVSKWTDSVIILPKLLLSLLLWISILTSCFKLYYWFYFFHPLKIKKTVQGHQQAQINMLVIYRGLENVCLEISSPG